MGNKLQTEIQSLNCPTTYEQEKKWKILLNKLNANNNNQIVKLLSHLDFKLLKTELNDKTYNPYYKLTVLTKDKLETELYLRINDPHPFNEYKVITNKVTIINYLKNNTKIPVETILSYSNNDCKTSLIETEYILTEKLKGLPLNQVFKTADQIPDSLIKEILSIYSELKSIKLDLPIQKIGYFDKEMKNISNNLTNQSDNSLIITNYLEYFNKELKWILSEMKKISQFSKLAQQIELIQQTINQINETNLDLNKMNFNDQMSIYHTKLNADNILVDPVTLKVTEIIGWENAYYGFDDNQVDLLLFENEFDGIEKTKLMKRFVSILDTLDWYKQQTGKIVRSYLSDLLNKSRILVFYFSTWFKVHKCTVDDHLNYQLPFLVHHLRAIDVFLSILKDYNNKKTTLNIITNEEFEALQSPSCKKQNNEMTKIIESLNDTKLKTLVESIGLKYIKGELFKQKNGIVNSIFLITVEEENNETKKIFLKISDTHPIFKNKKTLNEVSILKYLHNKIPVPEILSFSNDSSSSLIDCEYILMSSAKGTLLKELFDLKDFKDVNKMPNALIENMLDLVKEIELIKLNNDCQKIAGFDLSMSLRHPIVRFGPWIEACNNFLEFLDKNLIWTINEMNKIKSFRKLANDLDLFRLELIKVVENNNDLDNLNFKDEMNICHSDLHPGNIFVDSNTFKVSSVIDWEWCHYG
jgi:hypothetical protein